MVVKNGSQLCINPVFHDIRRILPINPMHLLIDKIPKLFGGVLDFGRKEVFWEKFDLFTLVSYCTRCINHNFSGNFFSKITEFCHHLIGRAEEKRARTIRIRKLFRGKQNMAVLFIFRIQKVHIRCCNHRLAEAFSEIIDSSVPSFQFIFVFRSAVVHQKCIVAKRLDLKVIIICSYFFQIFIAFPAFNSFVELSSFTGRTDNQSLAAAHQHAFGDNRRTMIKFEIRL